MWNKILWSKVSETTLKKSQSLLYTIVWLLLFSLVLEVLIITLLWPEVISTWDASTSVTTIIIVSIILHLWFYCVVFYFLLKWYKNPLWVTSYLWIKPIWSYLLNWWSLLALGVVDWWIILSTSIVFIISILALRKYNTLEYEGKNNDLNQTKE
jgi:hypothetical protein